MRSLEVISGEEECTQRASLSGHNEISFSSCFTKRWHWLTWLRSLDFLRFGLCVAVHLPGTRLWRVLRKRSHSLKSRIHSSQTSGCGNEGRSPCLQPTAGSSGIPREVHHARDGDDDKADDDGGSGHPLGIPPQPPGSFVVAFVVAVLRHDGEDQTHDVDGVRGAKTGEDCEPQVVLQHGYVLFGLVIFSVGLGTAAVQNPLEVRAGGILRHGRSRWRTEG